MMEEYRQLPLRLMNFLLEKDPWPEWGLRRFWESVRMWQSCAEVDKQK